MFATLFGKKKLTNEQLSNIFVNALIETVDNSFADVTEFLNDSPEFTSSPQISNEDSDIFGVHKRKRETTPRCRALTLNATEQCDLKTVKDEGTELLALRGNVIY